MELMTVTISTRSSLSSRLHRVGAASVATTATRTSPVLVSSPTSSTTSSATRSSTIATTWRVGVPGPAPTSRLSVFQAWKSTGAPAAFSAAATACATSRWGDTTQAVALSGPEDVGRLWS